MDIRKSKVEKNREWSANTQKVLASFLGVSAISMLAACVPSDSVTGGDVETAPPSSNSAHLTSSDAVNPESSASVSSSSVPLSPLSSSSVPRPSFSSSSFYYPPLAGVIDNSYPMSSGMPMNYSSSSSFTRMSSSSLMPPTSGVSMPYEPVSSSSSYKIDSLQTTAGEVYVEPESSSSGEPEPLAGIPELSSSSSEPEPLPGDPIELPEPLSGDVAEPEPMSGGAFGPQQFSGDVTESED